MLDLHPPLQPFVQPDIHPANLMERILLHLGKKNCIWHADMNICVLINHNVQSELSGSSVQVTLFGEARSARNTGRFLQRGEWDYRKHENDVIQRRKNVSFKDVGRSQDMMMQHLLLDPLHTHYHLPSDAWCSYHSIPYCISGCVHSCDHSIWLMTLTHNSTSSNL